MLGLNTIATMFKIDHTVGRLVEARFYPPIEASEIDHFRATVRARFGELAGRKAVMVTDATQLTILAPDVAEGFLSVMRADNPMIEQSAFLIAESAMFTLQLERMIREANNPARRAFRDPIALVEWLSNALTWEEHRRAEEFFRSR